MKITVSVKPRSTNERDFILRSLPNLPGKHSVPIPELLSNLFLLNVNCVRPQEFHERYTKLDDDDHAGLDDLANTYTSIPTFVELMHRATADWVVGQLREIGIKSQAKIKESEAAGTRRSEFKLPDGIHAITEAESRALLGDRQAISPSSLQKLIQEGKAYEEIFQLWGSHVVVLYVRQDDGTIRTLLIRDNGKVAHRLHYFLPPRQAALVYFFEIDVDLKDAEKAKAAITAPDIKRTPLRIADAINQVETDPTRIIDLIREFVDANIPGEGRELANAMLDFVALIPPEHVTLILDFLQLILDIVGMLPGAGEPADLANAAISAERGQKLDAVVGVAAMVPIAGALPGIGKALWRIRRIVILANALPADLRGILLDLVSGLTDEIMSLASRKLSDIVSGLKRRINEATDRLRIFAKKGDDASLPGKSGKQNSPSPSSKGNDAPAEPPPRKPPSKSEREGQGQSKNSKEQESQQTSGDANQEFINPLTNKKDITVEPTEMDHIYPQAEIPNIDGAAKLTDEQMKEVKKNPANLQPLPKTFNASKGKSLHWKTYKGQPLHPAYVRWLRKLQQDIKKILKEQIDRLTGK